ncbi:MAG: hypothetical protein AAF289_11885 [Cyanobacteria bacterium P01_A01_bin.135]
MSPRFATAAAWNQADLLMQPAMIRIIDNVRKHLETSDWRGDYRDVTTWPDGTCEEERQRVLQLQEALKTANSEEVGDIQAALEQLPRPYPGYELRLTKGDRTVAVDIWELCYRVCFTNYGEDAAVVVDESLVDELGDVDWQRLDDKAQGLVGTVFEALPRE